MTALLAMLPYPGSKFFGYHAGGLGFWSLIAVFLIRTRPSLSNSLMQSIGYGVGLGIVTAFTEYFSTPEDHPVLFLTGLAVGVSLFWVRYCTVQVWRLSMWQGIVLNAVAFIILVQSLGYVRASIIAQIHAPESFIKGFIKGSARVGMQETSETLFRIYPQISNSIIGEIRAHGLDFSSGGSDAESKRTEIIQRNILRAMGERVARASDQSVNSFFAITTSIIHDLSKNNPLICAGYLNGKFDNRIIVRLLGMPRAEELGHSMSMILNSSLEFDTSTVHNSSDWQMIWKDNLSEKARNAINNLVGEEDMIACERELLWRQDWTTYSKETQASIARGQIMSSYQ